jgi:hypothetical protein
VGYDVVRFPVGPLAAGRGCSNDLRWLSHASTVQRPSFTRTVPATVGALNSGLVVLAVNEAGRLGMGENPPS